MPVRIEIFGKPETEKPPVLRLNTRLVSDGTFEVFACDSEGKPLPYGALWMLYPGGRQQCLGNISEKLGLDLDDCGYIRFS